MPLGAGVEFLDAPLAAFGVLLVLGALVSGLADRSFLSLTAGFVLAGLVLGDAGFGALDFDPTLGVRSGPGGRRAHPDPVPRRSRGRGGGAPEGLAPAAPEPRAGDAAHRRAGGRCDAHPHRPRLDRELPPRRAAVAHGPGAELRGRHEPPGAAHHPALAEPGVRPQRRPGAAGGAGVHRRRGGQRGLRLVAVRAPGRAGGRRLGPGGRVRGLAPDAARHRPRAPDQPPPEVALRRRRGLRGVRHRGAPAGGQRPHRRRSWRRSRSGSGAPTSASASRSAPRT